MHGMLTKKESRGPSYDRSFLRDPEGLIQAGFELAAEDLIYFLKHPKMKDQKKLVKDAIKRIEKHIAQLNDISMAVSNVKLKIARRILKEKSG